MEEFTRIDIFDTKGMEYLFVIGYLVILVVFWRLIKNPGSIAKGIQSVASKVTSGVLRVPQGLFFSRFHTWSHLGASGKATVGMDDFVQHITGNVALENLKVPGEKIKKGEAGMSLEMTRTADILAGIGTQKQKTGFPKLLVGFAAESEDLIANAEKKLTAKSLDLIAANDISAKDAGFGVDTNRITLLFSDGRKEELPLTSKAEAAARILSEVTGLLEKGDN